MAQLNIIEMTGRISYVEEVNNKDGKFKANFSFSVNKGTATEPNNKYVTVKISSNKNLMDFNEKRVTLKGFMKGNAFIPRGSEKEVSIPRVIVTEITPLPKGRGENRFTMTMMIHLSQVGTGENSWMKPRGSISFNNGTQEKPEYKYLNLNISPKRGIELEDKKVVTLKGFPTLNDYKKDGKEVLELMLKVMEVVEDNTTSTEETSAPAETPAPSGVDTTGISDEEIPF